MCGIVGTNFITEKFTESIELLKHRGPDNLGFYQYQNHQFGHTRLSIIDLHSEANQPMVFDDIVIVFNGEIYNYKELTKEENLFCNTNSDTEVIIKLYKKFGTSFLNKLEGMFSFCIYDKKKNLYFAARDKFGEKPFYFYFKNKKFIYASEIKSILNILNTTPQINNDALFEYLSFHSPIKDNTFYQDIKKLEAGSYIILKDNSLKKERYFDINNIKPEYYNEKTILNDIETLLIESIEKKTIADVSLGSLLSGGIDSSFITAIYSNITGKKIDTFSLGFKEQNKYSELPYAKKVSKLFNTNHHEIEINRNDFIENIDKMLYHTDEPFGDTAAIPTYLLSKFVKKNRIKTVLSGEGGDECFLGYGLYRKLQNYPKCNQLKEFNLTKEWEYDYRSYNNKRIYQTYGESFSEHQKEKLFKNYLKKDRLSSYTSDYDNTNWMSYIDYKVWVAEVLMTKVDRMSMANSLEVRAPFLDSKLISYLFKVSPQVRQGEYPKYLLKKIAIKHLPKEIIFREKQGFSSPYIEWILEEYKEECLNIIKKVNNKLNIFNEDFVNFLYNESKNKRFKQHFWNIFIFAKWFNKVYL